MNKEMRQELKDRGLSVPRSNIDAQALYDKTFQIHLEASVEAPEKPSLTLYQNIYTYIGQGDEPPHMIKFMGKVNFVRGMPTEVSDPSVIAKLENHPCFVKGEYDNDLMFESDVLAKKEVDAQRARDVVTNRLAIRSRA